MWAKKAHFWAKRGNLWAKKLIHPCCRASHIAVPARALPLSWPLRGGHGTCHDGNHSHEESAQTFHIAPDSQPGSPGGGEGGAVVAARAAVVVRVVA